MKRLIITTDDAATVTVTGTEYDRTVEAIDDETVYRNVKQDKYFAERDNFIAAVTALTTEIQNWSGYDNAAIKASLGTVILPAVRRTMKGILWIGDYLFNYNEDAGPT